MRLKDNQIPERCKQCKRLQQCLEVREEYLIKDPWRGENCSWYEWDNKLTKWDFKENFEISSPMPKKCKQCKHFAENISPTCRTAYEVYPPSRWRTWRESCEKLNLFRWDNELTKYDFEEQ